MLRPAPQAAPVGGYAVIPGARKRAEGIARLMDSASDAAVMAEFGIRPATLSGWVRWAIDAHRRLSAAA